MQRGKYFPINCEIQFHYSMRKSGCQQAFESSFFVYFFDPLSGGKHAKKCRF